MSSYKTAIYIDQFISVVDMTTLIKLFEIKTDFSPDFIVMKLTEVRKLMDSIKDVVTFPQGGDRNDRTSGIPYYAFCGIPILVTHD